jgi:hypothetical protein
MVLDSPRVRVVPTGLSLAVVLLLARDARAADWHVDARNAQPSPSGDASNPFVTVSAAITRAGTGDTIRVAAGRYAETISVSGKQLLILGGFSGASSYGPSLPPGDFGVASPATNVTTLVGGNAETVVKFQNAGASKLDGFQVTGASLHGIEVNGGTVTISHNKVTGNGTTEPRVRGGGILTSGGTVTVADNVVTGNKCGRGAGIAVMGGVNFVVERNIVEDNVAHGDHGGGLYLNGKGRASFNVVRRNEIGRTLNYGFGGGILVFNPNSNVALDHNVVSENWAATAGGGEFIDDGASATVDHELIVNNEAVERGGAGMYVDGLGLDVTDGGSRAQISFSTIANNHGGKPNAGNGIRMATESTISVKNCIIWGNENADFLIGDPGIRFQMDHSISEDAVTGVGNATVDPLFADPAAGDYHLRSRAGRWDPKASQWVFDSASSPAIDFADPASPFAAEPQPNGGRAEIGFFGNTDQASLTGTTPVRDAGIPDSASEGVDSGGAPRDAGVDGAVPGTTGPGTGGGPGAVGDAAADAAGAGGSSSNADADSSDGCTVTIAPAAGSYGAMVLSLVGALVACLRRRRQS